VYTDTVAKISIRQIAAAYTPREWAQLEVVRVELDGQVALVKIARLPEARGYGGFRRWLVCPSCLSPVQTIAVSWAHSEADAEATGRFGCRRCFNWRSRRRRLSEALNDGTPEPISANAESFAAGAAQP